MIEALFKGAGRALKPALARQGSELPSTKGSALMPVAVVDSGGANIASVLHALRRLGVEPQFTADPRPPSARRSVSSCPESARPAGRWMC